MYDEDIDVDQPIICQNVYKGALHGIVNPLFEDHDEVLDLVSSNFDDDIVLYYSNKLDWSFSRFNSDCDEYVAFSDEDP